MIPAPANIAELAQILAGANARKEKVESVNLAALNCVLEHTPEDMTVTVEAGITLAELQRRIGERRKWLAIDPPHPETATISDVINTNASGPRRFGCGTIRDYLIGLTAVLADGTVIHSGGKVVKNVAGYDLLKLFVGGQGTIGVVVEATFKLRPLPEREQLVSATCKSLEEADKLVESVIKSEVTPAVFDVHKLSANESALTVVLGFAGTKEEVEWQLARVAELGFTQPASLDYEVNFWADPAPACRNFVRPSELCETLKIIAAPFVARAGNGIIYHRGIPTFKVPEIGLTNLMLRLKGAYDPNYIFPALPL